MKPVILAVAFSVVALASQAAEPTNPTTTNAPVVQAPPATGPAIVIELRELGTDRPVPAIHLGSAINNSYPVIKGVTDAEGRSLLPLPPQEVHALLVETVAGGGWVQMQWYWAKRKDGDKLPDKVTVVMEKGTSIGGRVVDDTGAPVAGATVTLSARKKYTDWQRPKLSFVSTKSQADGKWSYAAVPADMAGIQLGVSHPRYVSGPGYYPLQKFESLAALRDGSATLRLEKGVLIEGVVHGADGKPLANATVGYGRDRMGSNVLPEQKTDAQGRFACGAKPGDTAVLTVKAAGYAPELKQFIVPATPEPVVIELQPSHPLTGRVVDDQGKPITGATVYLDSWRGARTLNVGLQSDADGRFTYKDAPADSVEVDVYKAGYADNRNLSLVAGGDNQIVLHPPTAVTGTVVDAETGQPVPAFQVITGIGWNTDDRPILWQRANSGAEQLPGKDGKFERQLTHPYPKNAIRIEADGYRPANSETFTLDGTPKNLTFKLVKDAGITGVVRTPDGAPVTGVQLLLVTAANGVQIQNGQIPDYAGRDVPRTLSGTDGVFTFPAQTEAFIIVAVHDTGFAQLTEAGLQTNSQVTLQPWATVQGLVKTGTKLAPQQALGLHYRDLTPYDPKKPRVWADYNVVADATGHFKIDRVMAGMVTVSKTVKMSDTMTGYATSTNVTVAPGQTVEVVVGGMGRPLIGRLEIPADLKNGSWVIASATVMSANLKPPKIELPTNLATMTPEERTTWVTKWKENPIIKAWEAEQRKFNEQRKYFAVRIEGDGSFRIDDVPAGDYQLQVSLAEPPVGRQGIQGEVIATAQREFTIPALADSVSDEPFDLAAVPVTRIFRLKIGEPVPLLAFKTLDGKEMKSAEFKGKYVLLDFWATWCGPCRAELPHLKAIFDQFGKDDRFVMLGLSIDETPEAPQKYVATNDIRWLQGFVGQSQDPQAIPNRYGVRGIPALFLIDPDGKLRAKDLRGPAITAAIASALQK